MITPAYSITATERVLPKLALDFTTAVLDPRVTVTRALNTATRVNSNGLVEIVNADLPRFDFNPVSLVSKGLLIEEQRANIAAYSQAFNSWSDGGASVTSDAVVAPDGTQTADDLARVTTQSDYRFQAITFTGNGTKSVSIFVKYNTSPSFTLFLYDTTAAASRMQIDFSFTAGVPAATNVVSGSVEAIENFGSGWYRIKTLAPNVVAANSHTSYIYPGRSGSSNGQKTTFWGAQVENGAFATSYIPNLATGTTTRNADVVTMTGTNFSDWYNASNGAFVAWFDTVKPAGVGYIYSANAGGSIGNSFYQSVYANTTDNYVLSGGVQQARLLSGVIAANTQAKTGLRYANADFATAANGGDLQTQLSGSLPTGIDRLAIGSSAGGGNFLNGHVAKLFWYNRLTNAELTAFTK